MYAANGTSIGTCGDQDPPPRPRPPTDVPTEIHRRRCHVKIVTKIKEKKEFGSPHSYTLFYKDFDDSEQRLGVTKAENSSRLRRCLLSRGLFIRFLIMRLVKVLQDESLHSVSFRDAYSYYFGYRRVLCAAGYLLDSY